MATPRIFVSSTCMDFQETRRQLRQFIQQHGFEPVMSEFNDIFYDFDRHVQDSCKAEIERCNLFILIVGNRYGSIYHREAEKQYPDSVTLQEFRKALEIQIPKHIFIEKFLQHDYQNYVRMREIKYADYFSKHEVKKDQIKSVLQKVRNDFDSKYPFSQPQHKYVFFFLDLIHELETNNAIIPFDNFEEIRQGLINQWAGLMYEALDRESRVQIFKLADLEEKIDRVDKHIKELISTRSDEGRTGKISFDISKLTSDIQFENLEELKAKINKIVDLLLMDQFLRSRGYLEKTPSLAWAKKWVNSLHMLLKKYKWSQTIDFVELFNIPGLTFFESIKDIPYRAVFDFNQLYEQMDDEGKEAMLSTLLMKMSALGKPSDDIPF